MSHRPFFAVHHSLTSKWSGSVPSFQTYCSKVVDTTTSSYGEKNESCKVRSSLSLYSFESGYARCQCDEYCLKFDDCCPDFTGSLDCLGTIDGLECLVKHESLDDGLNGFNGDNGNPNLIGSVDIKCVSNFFPFPKHPGIGIYAITSCHPQFRGSKIERLCSGDAKDMLYLIPIMKHELVYKNIFCLLCNNIDGDPMEGVITPSLVYPHNRPIPDCRSLLSSIIAQLSINISFPYDLSRCQFPGFALTTVESIFNGTSRLGKLCVHGPNDSNQILSTASNDQPVFVALNKENVTAVNDPKCICEMCDKRIFPYITADMRSLANLSTSSVHRRFFPVTHYDWWFSLTYNNFGGFSNIFSHLRLRAFEDDFYPRSLISDNGEGPSPDKLVSDLRSMNRSTNGSTDDFDKRMISLSGGGTSSLLLLLIIVHMCRKRHRSKRGFSSAQRCQVSVLLGKLLLFLAFIGGSALRSNPICCKFFSVFSHWAMYVCFCNMIWFGLKVSYILWCLKRNMAALSVENQNLDMSKAEMVTFVAVWFGTFCLVITFWLYDTYANEFFQYGKDGNCLMSGESAVMYAFVIPSSITALFNFGLIAVCLILYIQLIENKFDFKKKLMIFLCRLITFQACQWIFGVVYYFSGSKIFRYIFEILISFEGLFIAITRYLCGI